MNVSTIDYQLDEVKIIQQFNRVAPRYESIDLLAKWVEESLIERLEYLNLSPQHILDLGAGTGRMARALNSRYPEAHLYAIDLSQPMLSQARDHRLKETSQQYEIAANAKQLPLPNDSIDLLCSNLMLPWCNDLVQVLTECARVLKPEGKLLFTTLGPDTLKELRQSWATVDSAIHVHHFFDMHHLGDLLLQLGFKTPVMDVDRIEQPYQEINTLWQDLKHSGASNLAQGRRRQLTGKNKFQAMLTAYQAYRTTQGHWPATFEVVYGYAVGGRKESSVI